MSEDHQLPNLQKPYTVEVTVDAPRDAVWRALTDPAEVRRWFGWDADSLDEEIRFIFVDNATPVAADRIEFGNGQRIELASDGPRTVVRLISPGRLDDTNWDDVYDPVEEGWRAFFQQLRDYLERHPGEDRRTIFLAGDAVGADVLRAVDAFAPGRAWYASRRQRGTTLDTLGRGLVVVASPQPLDTAGPARVNVTVTTRGLDDAAYAEALGRWSEWWSGVAGATKVTGAITMSS